MNRRPPEKRRSKEAPRRCCRTELPASPPGSNDDTAGYSAPSHMGGQFDEHGYGSGHGPIGFTQHVLP